MGVAVGRPHVPHVCTPVTRLFGTITVEFESWEDRPSPNVDFHRFLVIVYYYYYYYY